MVSNKYESLQIESLKQKAMTYLSKSTAEVGCPSNKSLQTQISPLLLPHLFFPCYPSCQKSDSECLCHPKCFPALSTLPWGQLEANYLMILVRICTPVFLSCLLFSQKARVRLTQPVAQSEGYKVSGCGRRLCLFTLPLLHSVMMHTDFHVGSYRY